MVNDLGQEAIQLILAYTKTWDLLLAYDEGKLKLPAQANDAAPSLNYKAAHLLYFIIKDHPFTDGNKRIGSFMFLLYLKSQNIPIRLNENGLVALAWLHWHC